MIPDLRDIVLFTFCVKSEEDGPQTCPVAVTGEWQEAWEEQKWGNRKLSWFYLQNRYNR